MSADPGERLPEPPRADLSMPRMLDVQNRKVQFQPRKLRNFDSALPVGRDAVEFIVKTDGPIPIRALGPALYVGGAPLTEVTEIGPNTYRFVAPSREVLKEDDTIHLSWTGQPPTDLEDNAFRYRPQP